MESPGLLLAQILADFTPNTLILDPQKLGARVFSDAHMISLKLVLFIFVF